MYRVDTEERIRAIEFSLASQDFIRRSSAATATEQTLYCRSVPNPRGVNSLLLGASSRMLLCSTCGCSLESCPGHAGEIKLSVPVFSPLFFEQTLKCLRACCAFCSHILMTEEEMAFLTSAAATIDNAAVLSLTGKHKFCPRCEAPIATYTRGGLLGMERAWPKGSIEEASAEEAAFMSRPFTPQIALEVLRSVPDVERTFFGRGIEKLSDLILESMPLPPPTIRPAVSASTGLRARGQDDLTVRYQELVRRSTELASLVEIEEIDADVEASLPNRSDLVRHGVPHPLRYIDVTKDEVLAKYARLQIEVFALINPTLVKHVTGAPRGALPAGVSQRKGLISKLRGKEGRIRGSLLGKRVDQSARSVITPMRAEMDVDELGIPIAVATTLSFPVVVTHTNMHQLRQCVLIGAGKVGGAASVRDTSGNIISLAAVEDLESVVLRPGYQVERHLADGDYVIFNRQPTLHRLGLLGHKCRILPPGDETFRLHLCVTSTYNADFDGDEMNLHAVQSPCAVAEVGVLMGIEFNGANPKSCRASYGLVQDLLLSVYLLTSKCVILKRDRARDIQTRALKTPSDGAWGCGEDARTGHQLLSDAFPVTFNFLSSNGVSFLSKAHSLISRDGCKAADLDTLHTDVRELLEARPIIISRGRLLLGCLTKKSVGVGGEVIDAVLRDHGGRTYIQVLSRLSRIAIGYMRRRGFSVGPKDILLTNRAEASKEIESKLLLAVDSSTQVLEAAKSRPSVSGAAEATTLQILSRVLLQTADTVHKFTNPSNSFLAMSRSGSKGSPMNISQICGALGQQIVLGKRVSRGPSTRILPCFSTGESSVNAGGFIQNSYTLGLSPTEFFFVSQSGREGLVDTAVKTASSGYMQRTLIKALEDVTFRYDGSVRNAQDEIVQISYGNDGWSSSKLEIVKLDLTTERVGWTESYRKAAVRSLRLKKQSSALESLSCRFPLDVRRVLRARMCEKAVIVPSPDSRPTAMARAPAHYSIFLARMPNLVFRFHTADAIHECEMEGGAELTERELSALEERIEAAACEPGEAVGLLAAQSLGEPATQLTLNSFHSAGTGAASAALLKGVPRLKELLALSRLPKTPTISFPASPERGEALTLTLKQLRLDDALESIQICEANTFFHGERERARKLYRQVFAREEASCTVSDISLIAVLWLDKKVMRRHALSSVAMSQCVGTDGVDVRVAAASPTNSFLPWIALKCVAGAACGADTDGPAPEGGHSTCGDTGPDTRYNWALHAKILLQARKVCVTTTVSGLKGVSDAHFNANNGNVVLMVENTSDTLRRLAEDCFGVAWENCIPNSIIDAATTLGVEAAAALLHKELTDTFSSGGASVDQRHVSVVVDAIVRSGTPKPFTRHGLNDTAAQTGPLVRASFEESVDVLVSAALKGETDIVQNSLSTSVICGARANVGTGAFEVLRPTAFPDPEQQRSAQNLVRTSVAGAREMCQSASALASLAYMSYDEADIDLELRFTSPNKRRRDRD